MSEGPPQAWQKAVQSLSGHRRFRLARPGRTYGPTRRDRQCGRLAVFGAAGLSSGAQWSSMAARPFSKPNTRKLAGIRGVGNPTVLSNSTKVDGSSSAQSGRLRCQMNVQRGIGCPTQRPPAPEQLKPRLAHKYALPFAPGARLPLRDQASRALFRPSLHPVHVLAVCLLNRRIGAAEGMPGNVFPNSSTLRRWTNPPLHQAFRPVGPRGRRDWSRAAPAGPRRTCIGHIRPPMRHCH